VRHCLHHKFNEKIKNDSMKLIILVFVTAFFFGCNNSNTPQNKEVVKEHDEDQTEKVISTEPLVLNKGVKWNADSITSNNVKNLLSVAETFYSAPDKSLASYKNAAADLQKGLDKMISECKMQGPDHEALHKWLRPLIGQVAELKKASTEDNAAKLMAAIGAQLNLYDQYFK